MSKRKSVDMTSPYIINGICKERCLIKSGRYYLCSRGGRYKAEKNIVKVPYIFRDGTRPLSIEVVREICRGCYNYGGDPLEDDKEFDKIILRNINAICLKRKLIIEDYGFVCTRGGPSNDVLSGVLEIRGNPYIFKIGKDKMSLDVVIRICNSACVYSGMYMI